MKIIPTLFWAATAALLCVHSSPRAAASVEGWAVVKGQNFWQEPGLNPQTETVESWFAFAGLWADPATAVLITNVYLERSGGTSPLVPDPDSGTFDLMDEAVWDTKAELDQQVPNNFAYRLFWTHATEGQKVSTLGPLGADNYPTTAPRIRNLAELQNVTPGEPVTIEWDPMPNGTANDFIQVMVWGWDWHDDWEVAESPWLGQPGALDGRANSYTLPGGLPLAGSTYEVSIVFLKVSRRDNSTQPGAVGVSGFARVTSAEIATSGGNCGYSLSANSANVGAEFGQGSFFVTAAATCSWQATSSAEWLIALGLGPGSGEVEYMVLPNTNAAGRVAAIMVGDQTFTVTQGPAGYDWHPAFGWIWVAGSGWYHATAYGWMWFSPDGVWIYSFNLDGWLASTDPDSRMLWSTQFRWLTPAESDPHRAETTSIGAIYVGQYAGAALPDGWVYSERFGYVWANGDGTWFYSSTYEWLGVTEGGGIWSVRDGQWL